MDPVSTRTVNRSQGTDLGRAWYSNKWLCVSPRDCDFDVRDRLSWSFDAISRNEKKRVRKSSLCLLLDSTPLLVSFSYTSFDRQPRGYRQTVPTCSRSHEVDVETRGRPCGTRRGSCCHKRRHFKLEGLLWQTPQLRTEGGLLCATQLNHSLTSSVDVRQNL